MTAGARILVVDDEAPIRRSLKVNLETRGYTVDTAETGEKAITAFENRRPDLLILDLLMPGMGGIDVVRKRRPRPLALSAAPLPPTEVRRAASTSPSTFSAA